jgi:hypothetical protein
VQLTFGAVRDPSAPRTPWDRWLDVILDAIVVITPKELSYRLNIKGGYLNDAIIGRDRKGVRAEWIPTIMAMAPDANRLAIVGELGAPHGIEAVRRQNLTPEERLARLEQRVATELGPMGARIVEENRR